MVGDPREHIAIIQSQLRSGHHIWCNNKETSLHGSPQQVCSIAKKKQIAPPQHRYFKNWSVSSTSMEANIIVAGFKASESMYGLHYTEVIGDGDSSALHTAQTTVPYSRDVRK